MANAGPNNDHVAAILSIPVCGVETRKDIDAALEAPFRRMAIAVGNTPHEHKGKGTPIAATLITDCLILNKVDSNSQQSC